MKSPGARVRKIAEAHIAEFPGDAERAADSYQGRIAGLEGETCPRKATLAAAHAYGRSHGKAITSATLALAGLVGFCITPISQKAMKVSRTGPAGRPSKDSGVRGTGSSRRGSGIGNY